MRYIPITHDRIGEVVLHLRVNFFGDEPLNRSVNIVRGQPGSGHHGLEQHAMRTMLEKFSVMAIDDDTDTVAGVCLNGIVRPGEQEQGLEKLRQNKDDRFVKIFRLLYEQNLKLDLFRRYETEEIFELRILSVDGRYRGQGVAKQLMAMSLRTAAEAGYRVLKGEATGLYSQKILQAEQFELVGETKYADCVDENGEEMFPVEKPHESLKIMIKLLPAREE